MIMKKKYNNIQFSIVAIRKSDIICTSPTATVSSDGVTGGHALAPDRAYDDFE